MIELPDEAGASALRDYLRSSGYDAARLATDYGTAAPPAPQTADRLIGASREERPLNLLVRLFLAGAEVPHQAWERLVPDAVRKVFERSRLVETDGEQLCAAVVLVPVGELLFASHAFRRLRSADAADFVMPASTHSARFLEKLTLRDPVDRMLDLGCGSGLHALAAAAHAQHVVATDVNPEALRFTAFNALLNGIDNVECREGDRFAPVAGERFGLIVSNPPFVIAPGERYRYRDNPGELDTFCAGLIDAAPAHLEDRGILQMLSEWAEIEGEPWQERIATRTRSAGCDAWVLHGQATLPAEYVARRRADVTGPVATQSVPYDEWLGYLESRRVTAIHPAMLLLRRREGRPWFYLRSLAGEPREAAAGAIRQALADCDFLADHDADAALGQVVLQLVPELELAQRFAREDGAWVPTASRLSRDTGLPTAADVDLPVMAFLNQLDGRRPLGDVIAGFAEAVNTDAARLRKELLPVVRLLIERGFLRPATPSDT